MGNVVRVAVREFDRFEDAIQQEWDRYKAQSGTTYDAEFVPMDLHRLHRAILTDGGLANGDWDIAFLSSDWFREAHDANACLNLTPLLAESALEGYPEDWPPTLIKPQQFGEEMIGFTWHDGPECLIYRTDLFNDPENQQCYKEQTGRDLAPATDWNEFYTQARFFQRPDEGLYGTAFAAFPDGHNTVYDFCLQVWSRGGELFDTDGNVNLLSEAVHDGLAFYRAIVSDDTAVHPRCRDLESTKAGKVLADGEVAFAVNWFGFACIAAAHESSKVAGKIDVAPVPGLDGGISLNSYWCLSIGAGSRHQDEAWKFIQFCATPEMDRLITDLGNIGCRKSTWNDPGLNEEIPFYHRLESLHEVARMLPQRPDWAQIADVIDAVVLDAINTEEAIPLILERHQRALDRL